MIIICILLKTSYLSKIWFMWDKTYIYSWQYSNLVAYILLLIRKKKWKAL